MRGGDHDGYARLVFDWGKNVPYTVTHDNGKLIIKFGQAGTVDAASLKAALAKNVTNLSVVSTSPLAIAITIPAGAKTQDVQVGGRVLVDVYDPPGSAPTKEPKAASAVKVAPSAPPVKTPAPKQATVKPPAKPEVVAKAEVKPVTKETPPSLTTPVAAAPVASASPPSDAQTSSSPFTPETAKNAQDAAAPPRSNLISISSINASGLAVFSRGGKIYIVNDQNDMLSAPQISGPDANQLAPMESAALDNGKVFRLNALNGAVIKGQGGGLLWRVMTPTTPTKAPPIGPGRLVAPEPAPTTAKKDDANSPPAPDPSRGGTLVWPLKEARQVLDVEDPLTGKILKIVTVLNAKEYTGPGHKFVDFDVLDSVVGMVILPKVDDLSVKIVDGDVEITRPGGLALTEEKDLETILAMAKNSVDPGPQGTAKRIFDFKNWRMGGEELLDENRNVVLNDSGQKEGTDKVEGLLTLAKMYLSNGMWAEAKGFLDLAEDILPELIQNPAFTAMHGAAEALGLESESAFADLSEDVLKPFPEVGYWRAFALADLGDWQQANEVMPQDLFILSDYPTVIRTKLSLVLAEVALRSGDTARGEQLLGFVDEDAAHLSPQDKAASDYLKGEAARQNKKIDDTIKYWKPLTMGRDPLYRAKAGLALTRLLVDQKKMKGPEAIDNLERLRYAWRGDDLESQIAYWLGKTYFENGDYVKGLTIMRDAASFSGDTDIGKRISAEMMDVFTKLFLGPDLDKISALDAAALHDQYADLIPKGPDGFKIIERLAERMVKADLLDKASELLQSEIDSQQDIPEAYRIATRLAAIDILDEQPGKAVTVLDKAADLYSKLPPEMKTPERALEVPLLRARALSKEDRSDQALALLKTQPQTPDVDNLRADIAWHAAYWDEASDALQNVILDRNISLTRPPSTENAALILQRAVALNLSGDRVGLAVLREKYKDVMAQTDKAHIFEVITRPRESAALADRDTLMGIVSEVDLFKDFLNNYKAEGQAPATPAANAPAAPAAAAAPTAAPADGATTPAAPAAPPATK